MGEKGKKRGEMAAPARAGLSGRGLLLVALLAVVPYLLLPANGFHSDARKIIPQNSSVTEGPLGQLFEVDFWGLPMDAPYATRSYRPLVSLTYALTVRAFGVEPRPLHLTDMGIHAGCAVLLVLLLGTLLPGTRWGVPLGILYAVHPVLSEAVCSFVGRADMIAAAAMLAALVLHLRAGRSSRPRLQEALAVLLLVVALLSKEYAVVFPFIFLAVDLARWRAGELPEAGDRRRVYGVWAGAFALLLGYLALRYSLAGALGGVPMIGAGDMPLYDKSLAVRWGTAAWLLLPALRLSILPYGLNYFYGKGTLPLASGLFDPKALAGVALVLAALGWAGYQTWKKRGTLPITAVTLALFPLGATLNTISLAGVMFAERFLYLPLAGGALALGLLLERKVTTERGQRLALITMGVVAVVFGWRTMTRVHEWSRVSLLVDASLESYPDSANAHFEKGLVLANPNNPQRDLAQAARHFEKSLEVEDRRPQVWTNYARALSELGRDEEAVKARRRAIELSPGDVEPLWRWLGQAELKVGRLDAAISAFRKAKALNPDQPETPVFLANALLRSAQTKLAEGKREQAAELAREAATTEHLPGEAYFLTGLVMARAGQPDLAQEQFQKALELDPDILRKRHRRAVELEQKGDHEKAAALFEEILAAQPHHVHTLFNLGRSLILAGHPDKAIAPLAEGLKLSNDPGARRWLQRARREAAPMKGSKERKTTR